MQGHFRPIHGCLKNTCLNHRSFIWGSVLLFHFNGLVIVARWLVRQTTGVTDVFIFPNRTKVCGRVVYRSCSMSSCVFQGFDPQVHPFIFNPLSTPSRSLRWALFPAHPPLHQNTSFLLRACVEVGASHPSLCDLSPCFHILSHVGSPLRCGEHSCWILFARTPPPPFLPPAHTRATSDIKITFCSVRVAQLSQRVYILN